MKRSAILVTLCFANIASASGVLGVGEADSLALSDHTDLTLPDGDWTIGMWVKGDNTGTGKRYLFQWGETDANPGIVLSLNRGSTYPQHDIEFEMNNKGLKSSSSDPGNTADWWHVIVMRTSNALVVYANGTAVISGVDATFYHGDVTGSFYIGNSSTPSTSNSWGGKIAEVAKWNDDLTADQREALAGLDEYAGDPQTPNSAAVNKTPTWYVPLYDDLTEVVIGAFSITNTGVTLDAEDHPVTYPTPVLILVQ